MNRSKFSILAIACIFLSAASIQAQSQRDTLQTFTYGSPSQAKFVFPPLTEKYEKILMHYKLRCPFDGPCGEWDYLMYIWLYEHTGKLDSVVDTIYSYKVNGLTSPTVSFLWNPTYSYFPKFSYSVNRLTTTSLDTATIGAQSDSSTSPFNLATTASRTQYLWKKSELLAAGLKKGDITGLRFNIKMPGDQMQDLTLRMKLSTRDSLVPASYEQKGMVRVYQKDTKFTSSGWKKLDFSTPFSWDGASNIVLDVSLNAKAGNSTTVFASAPAFSSGIASNLDENSMHFENNDFIDVPPAALSGCDSAITIAFWKYGNPKYQPQNQSSFEAINQFGQRVLNAHVPWSDGTVYWDAGSQNGGFDRIQKAVDSNDYKGKWTYWAFVKDVKTGAMTIYQDGQLFISATGKKKPMGNITRFRLGSGSNGDNNFDGNIDEFAVWNTALSAAAIQKMMGNDATAASAFKPNLRVYYKFNDGNKLTAVDQSGNGFVGLMYGIPSQQKVSGKDLYQGFTSLSLRPNITFEEGIYTSNFDTTVVTDSIASDVMQIIRYNTSVDGPIARDTLYVWPQSPKFIFSKAGAIIDSVAGRPADTMMTMVKTPYYRKFEIINRFEIGRYITPYGNGLNLGTGFTWTYDVSDYRTLLHDTVDLSAYNQQELVDVTFEFVKGTPPRDPISVRNLWNGNFGFGGSTPIDAALKKIRLKLPDNALNSRVKIRPTGHGFGDQENCAEFCPKDHWLMVDGTERYRRSVWREDCGLNPVYPQGGTWVYNRTNWCPGSDVATFDAEISSFVKPGDSISFEYHVDPFTSNGKGNGPYYDIETQLITYGKPNFANDAAIEKIKAPSSEDLFKRHNPICGNPQITIKNNGAVPLTSLTIHYGIAGAPMSTFHWTGKLEFMQSEDVDLGKFSWASDSKIFRVTISDPNDKQDEYPNDDILESNFTPPVIYPSNIVLEYKTNAAPEEDSYELLDGNGLLVWSRDNTLDPNTVYRDTLALPDGCYTFIMRDEGADGSGDGLSWWANTGQGSGTMKIKKATANSTLKSFTADFGKELYLQFGVGSFSGVENHGMSNAKLDVYPNPAQRKFSVILTQPYVQDVQIGIFDMLGNEIYQTFRKEIVTDNVSIDLSAFSAGTYIVRVSSESGVMSKKIVIQ